jgi:tetratricopeptide (TPR) repeat protein
MSMKRRLSVAVAILGLFAATADIFAQEWRGGRARVEGSVKTVNGEPIADAKVMLRWGQSGRGGPDLKTDKKGKWAIFGIVGGPWNVDVEAAGYLPQKMSVNISESERNQSIDVKLEPQPQAQAQSREELRVGGKTISKEDSEAIERANAAFQEKKFTAAREDYLKALAELPESEPLMMRIAAAYEGEGNTQDALKYARQAAEKDPTATPYGRPVAAALMAAVSLALIGSISWQGHASQAKAPDLSIIADLTHVAASAVWITGLGVTLAALRGIPSVAPTAGRALAARMLARFSMADWTSPVAKSTTRSAAAMTILGWRSTNRAGGP